MKKLFSILAASSLLVSAPLTVISCKKVEVVETIDYNYLINDFVDQTAIIFQSQIYEAFIPWNWMSDKNLPQSLSMDEIRENADDLEDQSSSFYKKVSNLIYSIIPSNEINKNLAENLASDIKYSPIVIDKGTPLKNGIRIKSLRGESKGRNFTLFIEMSTDIFYLDSSGLRTSQNVETFTSINILEVPNVLEAGKKINERFNDILYGVNHANEYSFESDKGNLENTSNRLEKEGIVSKEVTGLINKIDLQTEIDQILNPEMVVNNLQTKLNQNTVLDASRFATKSIRDSFPNSDQEIDHFRWVMKGMSGNKALQEEYFNEINNDTFQKSALFTDWNVANENDKYEEELLKAVEQDPTISKSINPYNLEYNYDNSTLKSALTSYRSLFKLDMRSDKRTIALFGANITGVGFKLDNEYYDLPNGMVCYRQKTTFSSTKELYDAYMEAAYYYQRNLFGLEGKSISEDREEVLYTKYYLELPLSIPQFQASTEQVFTDEISNQILTKNENANYYAEKFDLTSKWVVPGTLVGPDRFLYSGYTRQLQLLVAPNIRWNCFQVETYFFSSGLKQQNKPKFFIYNAQYLLKLELPYDAKERRGELLKSWSPWTLANTTNKG
ncbi:hypothetical protein [Spiroplasma endosymbiont of Panorpa germanica]|uniref:hypothetical protein n=1 Tax=Spiroplasma endosymbiont of Panorpa germanica TaxID=3066314 RepID=UPI0030D2875D